PPQLSTLSLHDALPISLIRTMASANPLWGAPRIHGELLKLGIEISERTVSRLMPKKRTGPSQTWKTFLANHIGQLVSIDFFTVRSEEHTSELQSRGHLV